MAGLSVVTVVTVVGASLVLALTDLRKMKVPNVFILPLLLSGLAYNGLAAQGSGLVASAQGALIGAGSLIVLYLIGGMGAGDVKMMAAVGSWLGPEVTLYVLIASMLATGAYSLTLIILGRDLAETWANIQILGLRLIALGRHLGAETRIESAGPGREFRRRSIPFAPMVALGILAVLMLSMIRH